MNDHAFRRAARECALTGAPVLRRDGKLLRLVTPDKLGHAIDCGSAPVARRAADLFAVLNVGSTPLARLVAAARIAEAAPVAARIRLHRRAS